MEKSKTFCIYPFVSVETRNNGDIGVCCRSQAIGNITDKSLLEIWNDKPIKDLRLALLNNETPSICDGCWRHENLGIDSKRTRNHDDNNPESENLKFKNNELIVNPDGSMPIPPQDIEFRVNNLCNLKCRMCNPIDSSSWNDWHLVKDILHDVTPKMVEDIDRLGLEKKPLLDVYTEDFYKEITQILPYIKKANFSGGEPLTNPAHYRILDILLPRSDEIDLKYDTNFLKLNFKNRDLLKIWSNFKSLILNVSVDGIDDVYNYIRTNGEFNDVKRNLDIIKDFRKLKYLVIASATSIYNVHDMPNVTRLAASYNAVHHMCKVSYPSILSCQILSDQEKNIISTTLQNFILELSELYTNKLIYNYVKKQYIDLISFLNTPSDSSLVEKFKNYERLLNSTRTDPMPIVLKNRH